MKSPPRTIAAACSIVTSQQVLVRASDGTRTKGNSGGAGYGSRHKPPRESPRTDRRGTRSGAGSAGLRNPQGVSGQVVSTESEPHGPGHDRGSSASTGAE